MKAVISGSFARGFITQAVGESKIDYRDHNEKDFLETIDRLLDKGKEVEAERYWNKHSSQYE